MEQTINIEELVQDDHNLNKGTEEGQRLMERSFRELGAGRSILVDKDGRIIAGNKSQKAAMAAGIKRVRVIETEGDELIAVKRTDLSLDSKEGRELAYADNLTTQVNLAWSCADFYKFCEMAKYLAVESGKYEDIPMNSFVSGSYECGLASGIAVAFDLLGVKYQR